MLFFQVQPSATKIASKGLTLWVHAVIGYAIKGALLISVQLSATKIAPKSFTLSVLAIIGYAISYAPYLSATVYQNCP